MGLKHESTIPRRKSKNHRSYPNQPAALGREKSVGRPARSRFEKLDLEVRKDEKLLKALGRAYRWHKMIAIGQYQSVSDLAEAENINKSYLQRMMRLMLLSPRIIDAVLNGQQPEGFALTDVEKAFSPVWSEQEKKFGFAQSNH
jgi:hypothetical protein